MMHRIMERIRGLPENALRGTCETDEAYVKAGSKGVALDTNGEDSDRSQPPRPAPRARPQHVRKEQADGPPCTFSGPPRMSRTMP